MKVVMAPIGTRGDVQPLLALAVALKEAGHSVTFCAAPDYRAWVEGIGVPLVSAGPPFEALLSAKAELLTKSPVTLVRSVGQELDAIFEDQFTLVRETAKDADILVGAGFQIVGGSVAESLGIPYQFVAFCPILLPTATYPSYLLRNQQLPRWANRLSWWVIRHAFDMMFLGRMNKHRARLGMPRIRQVYEHNLSASKQILLAWDAEISRVPTDVPCDVVQTPAWILPGEQHGLPEELEHFLQAGPPPLYIGFGSMTDSSPQRTTELLVEAVKRVGCRAVISKGWAKLASAPLPDGMIAVGSVPHDVLFPRMAAIVHHGGAGTTCAATRSGVPQVIVPHLGDQFFNGYRLMEAGLAPAPVFRSRLTVSRLEGAIRTALTHEGMRQKAQAAGQRLAGTNGVQEAVKHIEALVGRGK